MKCQRNPIEALIDKYATATYMQWKRATHTERENIVREAYRIAGSEPNTVEGNMARAAMKLFIRLADQYSRQPLVIR